MNNDLYENDNDNDNDNDDLITKAAELNAPVELGKAVAPESGELETEEPEQPISASEPELGAPTEATESKEEAESEGEDPDEDPLEGEETKPVANPAEGEETKPAADPPEDENEDCAPAGATAPIERS